MKFEARVHNCEKRLSASSCLYVSYRPPTWDDSPPTGRISIKFDIRVFFYNLSRKFEFH